MYSPNERDESLLGDHSPATTNYVSQSVIDRQEAPIQFHTDQKNKKLGGGNIFYSSSSLEQPQGWSIDPATKYFSIAMLIITIGLTTGFSIIAHRQAEEEHSPPVPDHYVHGECYAYRTFTLWKEFPSYQNDSRQSKKCRSLGLERGKPYSCKSDVQCQLEIPSYCLYGNSKFLSCDPLRRLCSVKTASLPVGSVKFASGVCPTTTAGGESSPDRCGDLLGNIDTSKVVLDSETLVNNPVICALKKECDDVTRYPDMRCGELLPNTNVSSDDDDDDDEII